MSAKYLTPGEHSCPPSTLIRESADFRQGHEGSYDIRLREPRGNGLDQLLPRLPVLSNRGLLSSPLSHLGKQNVVPDPHEAPVQGLLVALEKAHDGLKAGLPVRLQKRFRKNKKEGRNFEGRVVVHDHRENSQTRDDGVFGLSGFVKEPDERFPHFGHEPENPELLGCLQSFFEILPGFEVGNLAGLVLPYRLSGP